MINNTHYGLVNSFFPGANSKIKPYVFLFTNQATKKSSWHPLKKKFQQKIPIPSPNTKQKRQLLIYFSKWLGIITQKDPSHILKKSHCSPPVFFYFLLITGQRKTVWWSDSLHDGVCKCDLALPWETSKLKAYTHGVALCIKYKE